MTNPYVLSMTWTILLTTVAAFFGLGADAIPTAPQPPYALTQRVAQLADQDLEIQFYTGVSECAASFCERTPCCLLAPQ